MANSRPLPSTLKKVSLVFTAVFFYIATLFSPVNANADPGFRKWVKGFYATAARHKIKRSTYDSVFKNINAPIPAVLKSARYQPEFTSKIWDYLDQRIRDSIIKEGREMKTRYKPWLDKIEKSFGVDRHILLAIWSMESSYGAALENGTRLYPVAGALATLAYRDKKRAKFARSQLISALKIVQNGDISAKGLTGSWAGAMGHTQFIPTSYQAWAVDIDKDGRRNVWTSVPDALASSANLLKKNGWRSGKTWGYEVALPKRFNSKNQKNKTRTIAQWQKLGIKRVKGKPFIRSTDKAVLKLFSGPNGPAFLMLKNFYTIKRYNNADKYALAVGHLADRIRGGNAFVKPWPRGYTPLSEPQAMKLQVHLARLGVYDGEIDGNIGSGSKKAILEIQKRFGMKQNGYASKELLVKLIAK